MLIKVFAAVKLTTTGGPFQLRLVAKMGSPGRVVDFGVFLQQESNGFSHWPPKAEAFGLLDFWKLSFTTTDFGPTRKCTSCHLLC